ncbi:MAG: tRNA epoxyqueuosine(34) reductase QueG, partial [Bacteroidales bacterium]
GCDTCQLVCPWNKFAKPNETPEFKPKAELLSWTKEFVQSMSREEFNRIFKGSAVKRAKFEGWQRNADLLSKD